MDITEKVKFDDLIKMSNASLHNPSIMFNSPLSYMMIPLIKETFIDNTIL